MATCCCGGVWEGPGPWVAPARAAPSRLVPKQHSGAQRAEAFVRAFLKRSMPRMSQQALEDHLQRKAVVLEYFTHRKQKEKRKKSKGLSAKQRRELRLFDIKPEQQRYGELFLPFHASSIIFLVLSTDLES